MPTLPLRAHPSTPCSWIDTAVVMVERHGSGSVVCRHVLSGDISRLRIPAATTVPARTDGLWQHTCFELFARFPHGPGYVEFNFSPSGHWAAYQLDGYRHGMRELPCAAPAVTFTRRNAGCVLAAEIRIPELDAGPLQIAAAAVLEDREGGLSYWALQHSEGKPDFHHESAFAAQL